MKLHRLDLTGFGPFRETQTVDFDAFDGDGLFLITGRTGAGKSSILDGVSFALYGSVPRYDGGDRRLRSDHSFLTDPTEVRLEFTVGGARWRVTRAPEYERPAKRGGGMTVEPARAELDEWVDGRWVGRAAKLRDVGQLLDEVLGLTATQFQQVILLAQNKFSRFLLAGNTERQQLLRTLFGTRRFEEYKDALDERRRDARSRLDEGGARARTLLDVAEQAVAAAALGTDDAPPAEDDIATRRALLERAVDRAAYRVEARGHERDAAVAAAEAAATRHAQLTERAALLAELGAARAELAARETEAPAVDLLRARLKEARRAEDVRAALDAVDRAATALATAEREHTAALGDWMEHGGDPEDDLDARIETLTADITRSQAAADAERRLRDLDETAAQRAAELAAMVAALAEIEAQIAAVPPRRSAVTEELAASRVAASRVDDLAATRAALASRLESARTLERLTPEAAAAEAAYAEASAASEAAVRRVRDLLQRRLRGYAGELAASLDPGEPCPVCGAVEHPAPAVHADEPVSDDDLTAAEAARDAATAAERVAGSAAGAAREALAVAAATAAGHSVAAVSTELAARESDLADATAAAGRLEALATSLAGLDELETAARGEAAALTERLSSAREEQAVADAERTAIRRDVESARGAHPSVRDRIAADDAHRARARALIDARRSAAERRRGHREAAADLDARLAAASFADADAAREAMLSADERDALDARLADHAAALAAARSRALELELQTVDMTVGDGEIAASAAAVAEAEAVRDAAIAAAASAASAASGLRDLLLRIDEATAAIAGLADEAAATLRLADTVAGRAPNTMKMDLETFVLAAELEEIVSAANLRLQEMSSGRYTLHHADARQARGAASGLGIEVRDAHTGRQRSPQSLSGGETFLASLALALGLAEVVTSRAGGIRLDTLFIDEGFGSLDPETLDLAMRTLDELRAGGRVVGVISHVETMKEQIPAQLTVAATSEGPSVIHHGAVVAS